ncbi:MAG: ROK family protein [Thermomicrobiales bacterium]|nr:ROK family protein [Thermomicrobiales bacterium]
MALPHVLGVDLGGTNIRVAVLDADGTIDFTARTQTHSEQGPDAVIARIADLIAKVAADANIGADIPVGVASPGPLNPRTGVVHYTPNLPGWRDVPLVQKLQKLTGRRVALANDGNCAALGEVRFGSAKGCANLVYLALGTGIGGGVVTEGVLIDGKNGLGAEIGHTLVSLDGPRCSCGAIGCLEAFASGWAIQAEAMKVATTADGDRLKELAGEGPIHAGIVARAAAEGNAAAIAILERAGRALGASIGSFINIFDPEMIVIGGGVATLGEALMGTARKTIPQYSFVDMRKDVPVVYSSLGGETGLYGAGALAFMTFDKA